MHAELPVRVTPRSSKNKLELLADGSLRAWVTASPTDGQANDAICVLVASSLHLAKTRVQVIRGQAGRQKLLRIEGLDLGSCLERLEKDSE